MPSRKAVVAFAASLGSAAAAAATTKAVTDPRHPYCLTDEDCYPGYECVFGVCRVDEDAVLSWWDEK